MKLSGATARIFSRQSLRDSVQHVDWNVRGRIRGVVGNLIEASLPGCRIGTVVSIESSGSQKPILAEVVGFRSDCSLMLPFGSVAGVSTQSTVSFVSSFQSIPVSDQLLGRIIDPMMRPLDHKPLDLMQMTHHVPLDHAAPNPMSRARVEKALGTGIRAIDGLLTFGEGQRVGIMAGSGVGKSVLLGMIAKGSEADVNIIGLIGERGREVKEFIERDLGEEGLKKSIIVAVTGDQSPLLRLRGAKMTTALAEYFSRKGKRVLLMMDSLTRVAMAQREIGLSVGEPPTTKGYPPSVFSLLPNLLERCGPQASTHGSISGIYTVLVDGDDFNDPVTDAARSILDGHINLSRSLASKGHFPAIEVNTSASRVMHDIVTKDHWQRAQYVRSLLGVYQENFDFVQIGTYVHGSNPRLDQALRLMPAIETYLRQDMDHLASFDESMQGLGLLSQEQKNTFEREG